MATLTTSDAHVAQLIRAACLRAFMRGVEWRRRRTPANDCVEEADLLTCEEGVLREMRLGGWIAEEESKEVCNGAAMEN